MRARFPWILPALLATACASAPVVRETAYERSTLFELDRVTLDATAAEDSAAACEDAVVYDTDKDGNWEIYLKPLDGRELIRKTASPSADIAPTITADCSKIAFVSDREGQDTIYVISGRRASAALRVGEGASPAFEPAGRMLYYQRFLPGEGEVSIWRFDTETNQHAQLVQGIHPAVSPDGSSLAFARFNAVSGLTSLWVLNLATQEELEVFADPARAIVLPHWSPDGRRILFTLNAGAAGNRNAEDLPNFVHADLAVVGRDGSGYFRLTDNEVNDLARSWSGDAIFFTSPREGTLDVWRFRPSFADDIVPVADTERTASRPRAPAAAAPVAAPPPAAPVAPEPEPQLAPEPERRPAEPQPVEPGPSGSDPPAAVGTSQPAPAEAGEAGGAATAEDDPVAADGKPSPAPVAPDPAGT